VFFGLVAVLGTTYVQTGTLPLPAWYAAVGVGSLACAILVANNVRDIPTDREVGKRTLAVVLGDRQSRYLYVLLLWVALATLVGIALTTSAWALLGLAFAVPAASAARLVLSGTTGRALVPVLQQTGVAELLYAAGLFVGLTIGAVIASV
jgi:1,4-dihydroxy-2-naphthoate octaprenyltransferase